MTAPGHHHHHHHLLLLPKLPSHDAAMLLLLNKYLKKSQTQPQSKRSAEQPGMSPPAAAAEPDHACISGCVPAVCRKRTATAGAAAAPTTTRASRQNFVKSAASALFAGAHFTNHESLPGLPEAYTGFLAAFPQYGGSGEADGIRDGEYPHLGAHVCLDYTGINLFSHAQMNSSVPSTSSTPAPASKNVWQPPFFDIAYKSASLRSQVQCGEGGGSLGAAVARRIMASLKIPEEEYRMVCTANRTSAFRLLAESYSFQSGKKLLAVYDYESEAAATMAESAQRKGAEVLSASFAWPSMRIHSAELRKKLSKGRRKQKGLFVFPLVSRMSGARYPYLWMSLAHEHGWHVALDACALGTKDLDTFGLSLIRPDFIVCNFFKVFGENPSGFAGLFVKKSSCEALEGSTIARSIGIVSIVPARRWSLHDDCSTDLDAPNKLRADEGDDVDTTSSFSGPLAHHSNASAGKAKQIDEPSDEITETECPKQETETEIECRGLDHADALGLLHIGTRLRCITNWLVVALQKLRHPHPENGHALVRIYGPRVKFERGPSLAFNVYDWRGEKVEPSLVQKLADRHHISISCGFLQNIWFSDRREAEGSAVLERRGGGGRRKEGGDVGVSVVNASLGFLSNFEDGYKLWAFVAKFLDADFVEKERWRYTALNQKTVEV